MRNTHAPHPLLRRTLTTLCLLSLLLCLASATFWVRSHLIADHLYYANITELPLTPDAIAYNQKNNYVPGFIACYFNVSLTFARGTVSFFHSRHYHILTRWDDAAKPSVNRPERAWARHPLATMPQAPPGFWSRLGFAYLNRPYPGAYRGNYCRITLPLWLLTFAFAIPPSLHLRHRFRLRHRLKHNLCPHCSYDLRASQDKCPECGFPIPTTEP